MPQYEIQKLKVRLDAYRQRLQDAQHEVALYRGATAGLSITLIITLIVGAAQ